MLGNTSHAVMTLFCFGVIPVHYWLYLYEVRISWTLPQVANFYSEPLWHIFKAPSLWQPAGASLWDSPWWSLPPDTEALCSLLPAELRWLMHPTEYYKNVRMWLPRWSHQSHCPLHLLLLDYSLWGQPAALAWGHPRSPTERSLRWKTESSCQKPREWGILEVASPLPAKPLDD